MVDHITAVPRRIMALLQLGLTDSLASENTPWVCASCHTCEVRCPRGIDIPKVMEALRQLKLRENEDRVSPSSVQPQIKDGAPQIAMVSCFRKLTS
jgi:heterodisulfide reductase subunit C